MSKHDVPLDITFLVSLWLEVRGSSFVCVFFEAEERHPAGLGLRLVIATCLVASTASYLFA